MHTVPLNKGYREIDTGIFIGVNPAGDAGNILVGGDINGNDHTNILGSNVVEYELLIANVKRKQR